MGKHDPRARLTTDQYAFSSNLPSGTATALIKVQGEALKVEIWGDGRDELDLALPELLGTNQALIAEEAHQLPKPLLELRAQGLRRTNRAHLPLTETLVPIVLQQLVTWREAAASWRALLHRYGSAAPGPLKLQTPPSAETLANLSLPEYRGLGIAVKRARTIQKLSVNLQRHQHKAPEELTKLAMKSPGVGPWTQALFLGLEAGYSDVIPTGDYHLPSTVMWALNGTRSGTDEDMVYALEPYRGYRFDIIRLIMGSNISVPRRNPRMPYRRPEHR